MAAATPESASSPDAKPVLLPRRTSITAADEPRAAAEGEAANNAPSKPAAAAAAATEARPPNRKRKASTSARAGAAYPRKRAVNACAVCRARRTKCDNKKPKCSFCESVGAECRLESKDPSTFDPASLEILDRLSRLEEGLGRVPELTRREVEKIDFLRGSQVQAVGHVNGVPPVRADDGRRDDERSVANSHVSILDSLANGNAKYHRERSDLRRFSHNSRRPDLLEDGSQTARLASLLPQTVQDIVRWPAITSHITAQNTISQAPSPVPMEAARARRPTSGNKADSFQLDQQTCRAVTDAYLRYSNIRNPIFDESGLRALVAEVHDRDFEWDAASCLVLMVCANGALAMPFDPHRGISESTHDCLADSMFQEAERRLGAVFSAGGLIQAQALFLCGVFHMCRLRALEAWRMFHAALSVCQSFDCTLSAQKSMGEPSSLEERVYWSAWKSESELRWELGLRDFSARAIDHPVLFPSLPKDQNEAQLDSWYFYLSEISLWRLHFSAEQETNRLVKTLEPQPLEVMASQFESLERQVLTWQSSLAPPVRLGDFPMAADDWQDDGILRYILKSHVTNYYELITWPFVSAVINDEYGDKDAAPLEREITRQIAAKGFRWHVIRLQVHPAGFFHRHHGTWLMQRRSTRSALLLLAAALHLGTRDLLPEGWATQVEIVIDMLHYWAVEVAGAGEYAELLEALLARTRM